MHRSVRRILAGIVLLATGFGVTMSATPAATAKTPHRTPAYSARGLVGSTSSADVGATEACPIDRYGYRGYAGCGTHSIDCDFTGDLVWDETWVIAADRTIWHAWPGSGRWHEM